MFWSVTWISSEVTCFSVFFLTLIKKTYKANCSLSGIYSCLVLYGVHTNLLTRSSENVLSVICVYSLLALCGFNCVSVIEQKVVLSLLTLLWLSLCAEPLGLNHTSFCPYCSDYIWIPRKKVIVAKAVLTAWPMYCPAGISSVVVFKWVITCICNRSSSWYRLSEAIHNLPSVQSLRFCSWHALALPTQVEASVVVFIKLL